MRPDQANYSVITTLNANANSGVATANSTSGVIDCTGMSTLSIQTDSNTLNQPLTLQVSNNASGAAQTWIDLGGTPLINSGTGVGSANVPASTNGIFQADISAYKAARLTQKTGASTGTVNVSMNASSTDGVVGFDSPIPAGSAQIGLVGTPSGSAFILTSLATTNPNSVKTTATSLFEVAADNLNAADRFIKFYNKASAPTVGTDIPIYTKKIPANGDITIPFGNIGKRFTTGLAYAITGLAAVTDTTAIAAGDVHLSGTYI